MFVIYSPELEQVQAATRFSNIAAEIAYERCRAENNPDTDAPGITFQVWEVDEIPDHSIGNFRRDDRPFGRLVGTVGMTRTGCPAVGEEGWSW